MFEYPKKVSFNIASEASGQKAHKNCQKWPEACGQIVLPDRSILVRQNWNATFWVIFKHREEAQTRKSKAIQSLSLNEVHIRKPEWKGLL